MENNEEQRVRLPMRIFCWNSLSFVVVLLLVCACATSPTGRSQLMLVSDAQMNQMGVEAFQQTKQQMPQEADPALVAYVKCIAAPIARKAKDPTGVKDWEVVVFKDPTANAFALPGGKIGVHTGIIKVAQTPDQLAAVLGHEVAHVIARHGNERVSQAGLANMGMEILRVATQGSENQQLLLAALGLGAQYGVLMPHSRKHESEADEIGQELMAKAGFDPRQSIELWKNMAKASSGQPPEFLSTHPSHQTRIQGLERGLSKSLPLYQKARDQGISPNCVLPQS